MPTIELTEGTLATLNISSYYTLKTCQGSPIPASQLTFYYDTGSVVSSTKNAFITFSTSSTVLTVDARTSTSARAGWRTVYLNACTLSSTVCQALQVFIVIYPSAQVNATSDVRTKTSACKPGTEWPKVIGDTNGNSSVQSIEINPSNGYMLLAGWTDATTMKPTLYRTAGIANAFVMLTNNLMDI